MEQKRTLRNRKRSTILSDFFNPIVVSQANPWLIVSPLSDRICPTVTATHLCFLKPSDDAKKGKKNHVFVILQCVHSPNLQLNCCFWSEHMIDRISSHRINFAPPPAPPACVSWNQATMQKMVRALHAFSILLFVHSPFFQLNHCFRSKPAIHCISSHRPKFAPPPPPPPPTCMY